MDFVLNFWGEIMHHIRNMSVAIGTVYCVCFAASAAAQTGAATAEVDRRDRGSVTIGTVVSSENVSNAGCDLWFPGMRYEWEQVGSLSRGDLSYAPAMLIGYSGSYGIGFRTLDDTAFGVLELESVPSESGCDLIWHRSVYETDPTPDGVYYRYVLNYRTDHRVALRQLIVSNGQTEEMARVVYQRGNEYVPRPESVPATRLGEERVERGMLPPGVGSSVLQRRRR